MEQKRQTQSDDVEIFPLDGCENLLDAGARAVFRLRRIHEELVQHLDLPGLVREHLNDENLALGLEVVIEDIDTLAARLLEVTNEAAGELRTRRQIS